MPKEFVKYGYKINENTPVIKLELQAYKDKLTPEKGGLGIYEHFRNAWFLAWPDFKWNDYTELMIRSWCGYDRINCMGGSGIGKTFTFARAACLDWLAAPDITMTSLATVTADGLRLRMWGDLMRAYEELNPAYKFGLDVRSTSNCMNVRIDSDKRDLDKYIIEGMAVSRTADASGRIRGKHAPRRRVILDEADDMPPVIYETFANIMSDPDVKIVDLSNATDRYSNFCKAAEPKDGWDSVTPSDLLWQTKTGICIHLDGMQNPNIVKPGSAPFMMDMGRVEAIKKEFGEESKEWWSFVRGFPPPDGIVAKVWPGFAIEQAKKTVTWDFKPEMVATLDPAYEHDDCVLMLGEMGKTRAGDLRIQATKSYKIQLREGRDEIPKDYQIKEQVMKICKEAGVSPCNFIMDKSGNGRSVWSKLVMEWSNEIIGIDYGGEATTRSMRKGDPLKANEMVQKFVSELWFRARYMAEAGCLCGLSNLDTKTIDDLNARRYERKVITSGSVMIVEKKEDLKKRLGRSPDFGDAYCQFAELLARKGAGEIDSSARGSGEKWRSARERAALINAVHADYENS